MRATAGASIEEVEAALDEIAGDLRSLWAAALESGDFAEITRIVEASHAVNRAAIALRSDSLFSARGRVVRS